MSILDLKDINVCVKDIKSISIDVDDDNNLSCLYVEHIKDIDAHNNIAREIGNIPMHEFSIKKLRELMDRIYDTIGGVYIEISENLVPVAHYINIDIYSPCYEYPCTTPARNIVIKIYDRDIFDIFNQNR